MNAWVSPYDHKLLHIYGNCPELTHLCRWISSAQVATKMVLLARTTPLEEVKKPSEGLSLFFVDLDKSAPGLELKRIKKMGGRAIDANEIFFDNFRIAADTLIGKEGEGFKIVSIRNSVQDLS